MSFDLVLRVSLEGAVFAAVVGLLCRMLPRLRAGQRALLWWLVSAKLLVGLVPLPAVPVAALPAPAAIASPARAGSDAGVTVSASTSKASARNVSPAGAAGWIWLLGGSLFVIAALPDWLRVRRWLRAGRVVDDDVSRLAITRVRMAVGLRRAPRVLAVAGLDAPVVAGFFRPAVLFPTGDLERLRPDELEMALAHEMAHVARGDLWLGLVPSLARRIFFFHPAAWIAEREHAISREAACDEAVLGRRGADAFAYGQLLLRLTTRRPVHTAIPMSPPSMLRRRLEMIENMVRRVPIGRAGWALVAVVALAIVPVRLVAKETREPSDRRCLDIGNGKDNAYVVTDGASHSMCGDVDDVRRADTHRHKGEDVVWFRVDDASWVVRDPAVVASARQLFAPVSAIGEKQAAIGEAQSRIGIEQSKIGAVQGEIGMRQATEAQRQAEVALEQTREVRRRDAREDADDAKEADDVTDEAAALADEVQAEKDRAQAKAALDGARSVDALGARMGELGVRMNDLGARMEILGRKQEALGEQQRVLGEKMEGEIAKAQRALSQLLERAMRDGTAQRAD